MKTKKLISVLLVITMVASLFVISAVQTSAKTTISGEYVVSDGIEGTQTVYFYMPDEWKNEYTQETGDSAGAYWWSGSDACDSVTGTISNPSWLGYKLHHELDTDEGAIFSLTMPTDVSYIVFNNFFDGGADLADDRYLKSAQTANVFCEKFYEPGDSELYDTIYPGEKINFDGMIYVCDKNCEITSSLSSKKIYSGEWYFYYGDGKYGYYKTEEEAIEKKVEHTEAFYTPFADDSEPKIYLDLLSLGWTEASDIYCHIYNYEHKGNYPGWQSKAEKCTVDAENGVAIYDFSTAIEKGYTDLKNIDESNNWLVTFSTKNKEQTCEIILNSNHFEDTVYCPDGNFDTEKTNAQVVWKSTNDGVPKEINTMGELTGDTCMKGKSDDIIMADFLIDNYENEYLMNAETLGLAAFQLDYSKDEVYRICMVAMNSYFENGYIDADELEFADKSIKATLDDIELNALAFADVNGDGMVSVDDATMLQKSMADVTELSKTRSFLADVNQDKMVNIDDATLIQKYVAEIVTSF